ncbi:MAG: alpha/beta fold hydrolase [Promethearchaeota archaeon]
MPYIKVNDLKIFYYDNNREGTPLLFIHGWLGSSIEWRYQLFYFDSKKHILLLDLPGFGKSDKPKIDYSVDFFSEKIISVLKLLKYNYIYIIGHSFGGLIALNIAYQYPNLIKKLVLISTPIPNPRSIREKLKVLLVNKFFGVKYHVFLKNVVKRIIDRNEESREFKKLYNYANQIPKSIVLSSFKNMIHILGQNNFLNKISQPKLLIYGTEDNIISNSIIPNLSESHPFEKVKVVTNGSHRVMFDNYEEINEIIEEFISD